MPLVIEAFGRTTPFDEQYHDAIQNTTPCGAGIVIFAVMPKIHHTLAAADNDVPRRVVMAR